MALLKVAPGSPNAISNGTVDLSSTTNVSNTLATTNGGTGTNSLPSNQILIGNAGGTAITGLGNLTNGQLLIGDGDGIPTAATLTAGSGITITNGAGTITIASNINATQLGVTTTTDFCCWPTELYRYPTNRIYSIVQLALAGNCARC